MAIAFAVYEQDWGGYVRHGYEPDPDGTVEVTKGDVTFPARRVETPVPAAFRADERMALERVGRVVRHRTYSLQQETFQRAGFQIVGGKVQGVEVVVCIATEDRYDIFPASTVIRRYESVEEWRLQNDYGHVGPTFEFPGQTYTDHDGRTWQS
jgi:hypothetical protein